MIGEDIEADLKTLAELPNDYVQQRFVEKTVMTPETKPVSPHYSPTRRALTAARDDMIRRVQSTEESLRYHREQIQIEEMALASLTEHIAALNAVGGTLSGLDKAGIIVEPSS